MKDEPSRNISMYTKPPYTPPAAQRQWVGLTDEERNSILDEEYEGQYTPRVRRTVLAIESKLREKNT